MGACCTQVEGVARSLGRRGEALGAHTWRLPRGKTH